VHCFTQVLLLSRFFFQFLSTLVIFLTDKEHLAILLMLVKNLTEPTLRCGAVKVLTNTLAENSIPPATKDDLQLCSEVFAGLASSLRNTESDGFTEITLIELGLSSSVELRDLRVYEDYCIVLPVVGLVQSKSTSVKLHIAQTVRIKLSAIWKKHAHQI
jgi:hypothetical protein